MLSLAARRDAQAISGLPATPRVSCGGARGARPELTLSNRCSSSLYDASRFLSTFFSSFLLVAPVTCPVGARKRRTSKKSKTNGQHEKNKQQQQRGGRGVRPQPTLAVCVNQFVSRTSSDRRAEHISKRPKDHCNQREAGLYSFTFFNSVEPRERVHYRPLAELTINSCRAQ